MDQRDTPERDGDLKADDAAAPVTLSAWLAQNAFTLVVVALVAGVMVWKGVDFLVVGKVAVGLGLIIFIHELGHFLAAKWCDVHVETFSIGFGPPLPGCRFRYGETTYMIALFPLGGYVKMVGEGADDEGDDDPRSFKNKSVGQRMLIISAGVVMNVLLAAACFVGVYTTTGVDHVSAVIGVVDAGSPAWQQGLRPGIELTRIGSTEHPYFDDVMPEVMHWPAGKPIPVEYQTFGATGRTVETEVTPRKNESTGRPMIGIAPARTAVLHAPTRRGLPPYRPDSAASKATPPFRHGDRVVGTTDPDDPATTKPLPPDPRDPQSGHTDYFELARRLQRLAGQEMTILVRHEGAADGAAPEAVHVPPAFYARYGLRMRMGPVLAVRADSPAAREGVQPRRSNQEPGDILTGVEVTETDGSVLRFVSVLSQQTPPKVTEKVLDPIRLPYALNQWAARRAQGPKTVKLKLDRQKGHKEREEVTLQLNWDDRWRFEQSAPSSPNSPQAIDGLGLAYAVMTAVEEVEPGSPAAAAGIQKGDVIKAVQFYKLQDGKPEPIRHEWDDLEPIQWANTDYLIREVVDSRRIGLRVARGDKETFDAVLDGVEDSSWPAADRGLAYEPDTRLQKADNLGAALLMGVRHTGVTITRICQNLMAMVDGRISFPKNASGPLSIAVASYDIAGESLQLFVLFLGMISVNLAVINFLPIPVLDGGHMVFLLYEKLRGRPAPETVRVFATFAGLAMIGSLMLFVIYLDVRKLW